VNDVALVAIAIAVTAIAIVQVVTLVVTVRLARQVGEAVGRFEQDVRPVVVSLQSLAADAARAAAIAAAQVERADRMLGVLRQRIDQTALSLQAAILSPARDLMAVLQALRETFFGSGRGAHGDSRRRQTADEEDALFIG
jgi:hypothetical protein